MVKKICCSPHVVVDVVDDVHEHHEGHDVEDADQGDGQRHALDLEERERHGRFISECVH